MWTNKSKEIPKPVYVVVAPGTYSLYIIGMKNIEIKKIWEIYPGLPEKGKEIVRKIVKMSMEERETFYHSLVDSQVYIYQDNVPDDTHENMPQWNTKFTGLTPGILRYHQRGEKDDNYGLEGYDYFYVEIETQLGISTKRIDVTDVPKIVVLPR